MGKSKILTTDAGICRGCLSVDRKLSVVLDGEHRNTILGFIEPMINPLQHFLLCWECTATLNKVIRFSNQVRKADENLSTYFVKQHPQPIPTLSRLNFSKLGSINHIYIESQDDSTNTNAESQHFKTKEPLFIKVEDQDCESIGDDMDFCDDNMTKIEEFGDDNKAGVTNLPISRADEFNDSDDEPLKRRLAPTQAITVPVEYSPKKKRRRKGESKKAATGGAGNARAQRKLQQLNMAEGQVALVTLSWDEVESERQKCLSSEAFLRLEHRCYSCVVGFNHRAKYQAHMTRHDPSAGLEVCQVCSVRCRDSKALDAHLRRHRVRWRCSLCPAAWSRAAVAADHYARAHQQAAATHRCAHAGCGHVAPTLGKLRVHLKCHGERQRCEICDKTFRDRASLKTHLFIHKGEKEYACPECNKMFLFKKAMQVHLITHLAPQHLYCRECDMTFKNRMSFYGHMKYNLKHIDPAKLRFVCQLCDKKFAKAVRLQEHRAAIHLKITPIKCTVEGCAFACASRPVLRTHTRTAHRNARAARNHVCHTCGKAYTTKKSLEGHLRSHTGARPFQCAHCPSNFGYEAALYNHNKLVHSKGKNAKKANSQATAASWAPGALPVPAAGASPADHVLVAAGYAPGEGLHPVECGSSLKKLLRSTSAGLTH